MPEQSVYQGLSREETLQQLLLAITTLSTGLMNQSTADVQKQIRDSIARDTTLQQILTALPQGPALDSTVLSLHTDLVALIAKTAADPATQATLASALSTLQQVLAKMPADPATKAAVDAVATKLSDDPATQTTLAAVLAKLPQTPPVSAMWRNSLSLANGSTTLRPALAGQKHYVTGIQVTNSTSLIAVAGSLVGATISISILDGTSVIWSDVLAAGTRTSIVFGRDAPLVGSTNTALVASVTALGVMVNIQGYDA